MGEWAYVKLEENVAKRNGMPKQIPVPKEEFEGLAETGLDGAKVRTWISKFMQEVSGSWRQQNNELASRYDAFLAKGMHWDKAQKAFQKGDSEGAIKALKMITRVDKEDAAAKLNLAMALAASGQYPEALEAFTSIEDVAKGDPEYHVARANVHMALQQSDDAINQFADALEAKPDCKPAMDGLVTAGLLMRVYEDPKDAASLTYVRRDSVLEYFEQVWDAEERDAEYLLEQIGYHELEKRWDVVIAAADRVLAKSDGTQDRAAAARIAALRSLKREDATSEAKKYLEAHPDSVPMLVELAQCVGAYGDEGKALLDKALELDPGDQIALTLRYWPETGEELKPLLAALPALQAFAESHAESAGAWRSVGRAMLRLGKDDEALAVFRKAIDLAPDDDDLRSEFWSELGRLQKWDDIIKDAEGVEDITKRSWQLRWGEAEAYAGVGKKMEARTAFTAINQDESLLIDIRKRAKRAAERAFGGE
ncbi:MAG: tetratricopeptide repeat protein [Polyangiaceae bacterium]|nr:tetratricopeptide repeat protein [Myxococcales bacterium]MCB9589723.1 tetratricopeptide repeat protein [Polyangiaceae bacterium]